MSDSTLLLGPIALADFEIDGGMTFGGGQRLAVHELPGGARVVDALGRQDAVIRFHGYFTGSDATLRARAVDELRAAGLPLPLTWDAFFYTVVIRSFSAEFQASFWIPYRIECEVVRDEASAVIGAAVGLAGSLIGDVSTASGLLGSGGVDLGALQAAIGVSGATTAGTAAFAAATSAFGAAGGAIDGAMRGAEAALVPSALFGAGTADAGVAALGAATGTAQTMAALSAARGYVLRGARNLADAST
jgi:hypothetical protein